MTQKFTSQGEAEDGIEITISWDENIPEEKVEEFLAKLNHSLEKRINQMNQPIEPTKQQRHIFQRILEERQRQTKKWGDQSGHPDGVWSLILTEEVGEWAQAVLSGDIRHACEEMLQIVAVGVQWLEIHASRNPGLEKMPEAWLDAILAEFNEIEERAHPTDDAPIVARGHVPRLGCFLLEKLHGEQPAFMFRSAQAMDPDVWGELSDSKALALFRHRYIVEVEP